MDFEDRLDGGLIADPSSQIKAIFDSANDAIISEKLDGTVTSWNRAAEQLYGYSSEEIIGKHISILAPPETQNEIQDILEKMERGERIEHFETVRLTKDGTTVDVSVSISPVFDSKGDVVGASTIARDLYPTPWTQLVRIKQHLVVDGIGFQKLPG